MLLYGGIYNGEDEIKQRGESGAEGEAADVLYLHDLKKRLDGMLKREGKLELAVKCFQALQLISELEISSYSPEELFQH